MADLTEAAEWPAGIYQLEQNDPVLGGPPNLAQQQGFDNVPHQMLANRTVWLRAQLEALQTLAAGFVTQAAIDQSINSLVDGAPAALNTLNELAAALDDSDDAVAALTNQVAAKLNASAYTAADVLAKLKSVDGPGSGVNADLLDGLELSTITASIAAAQSAADAAQAAADSKATPASVTAAINSLVDGAPAALNTLNELAAALDDSDDAVAALTSQVAAKLNASAYTAANVLAKLKTVDGAGSGLDADRLQGQTLAAIQALISARLSQAQGDARYLRPAFESALLPLTSSTIKVAHGLGVSPTFVHAVFVCKSANNGYSVGDEIHAVQFEKNYSSDAGHAVWANVNSVGFSWHSKRFLAVAKNGSNTMVGGDTYWRLKLRAFL